MKNALTKATLAALTSAVILLPAQLQADGNLGSSSEDTLKITIAKNDTVRISGLEDVDFGAQSAMGGDTTIPEPFCVFASNGGYRLTASSSSTGASTFQMTSGANALDYYVNITSFGVGVPDVIKPLFPGQPVDGLHGNTVSDTCLGGVNAVLDITVLSTDFNAAAPGAYSDTVTLFVEPE